MQQVYDLGDQGRAIKYEIETVDDELFNRDLNKTYM